MADEVRRLCIVSCEAGYTTAQFTLYNVKATDGTREVSAKLNCFKELKPGWGEFRVKPYKRDGQVVAYTLEPIAEEAGGDDDDLRASVNALAEMVRELQKRVSRIEEATAVGEDIPF